MALADILARKKAEREAAEAAQKAQDAKIDVNNPLNAIGIDIPSAAVPVAETKIVETIEVKAVPAKETFAERMARLKREKEASTKQTIDVPAASIVNAVSILEAPKEIDLTPAQKEVLAGLEDSNEAQAYTDIVIRINSLQYAADGEPLKNAMKDLTESLKKNASACLLLQDPDIGQMVIHLRKLVGEKMEEAKAAPKGKKKSASALTKGDIAEQLAIPEDF